MNILKRVKNAETITQRFKICDYTSFVRAIEFLTYIYSLKILSKKKDQQVVQDLINELINKLSAFN